MPKLYCREIYSSMNDPIKKVQITLDKIHSHLLFLIEQEFMRFSGKLLSSGTGIQFQVRHNSV